MLVYNDNSTSDDNSQGVYTEVIILTKANAEIRGLAKMSSVPLWTIALRLNVAESTLIRWLRVPLDEVREKEIRKIIADMVAGDAND